MAGMLGRRALAFGFDMIGAGMDPALIWMLKRYHFPSSRLWAAANASAGDLAALSACLPEKARRRAELAMARAAYRSLLSAKAEAEDATARWREIVLAGADGDPGEAERARRRAATRHLGAQAPLAAAIGRRGLPLVDWAMTPPNGDTPPTPEAFDAPADLDDVTAGPVYQEGGLMRQWLAAPAETGIPGDVAYARVSWPAEDAAPRAAVVAGSGVGVEWDLYVRIRADFDFATRFTRRGLAAIEIVSPGHGLRAGGGRYGGEIFFASAPVSSAALLVAQTREVARFVAWAKRRWDRPTGVFGLSMSSFAAQFALSHAVRWPEAARPDVGLLLAHSDDLMGVVNGRLSKALGIGGALKAAGWTEPDLEPWRKALAPAPKPAVAPDRIVSVVGALDQVTPSRDGRALAKRWELPKANRFCLPHGHMCLATRVSMNDAPVARFADQLAAAA